MELNNRLQFVHCDELFANLSQIKEHVKNVFKSREGKYGDSGALFAEPMVFKYGTDEENPNIVLAIGAVGDGSKLDKNYNVQDKLFYIDFADIENSIALIKENLDGKTEELERINRVVIEAVKSCGLNSELDEDGHIVSVNYIPSANEIIKSAKSLKEADELLAAEIQSASEKVNFDLGETETIKMSLSEKDGVKTMSSDLKLSDYEIVNGKVLNTILKVLSDNGLFLNIDLDYNSTDNIISLLINGVSAKEIQLPEEIHIVSGKYDKKTEEIIFTLNNDDTINVSVEDLIDEWTVENNSPIVLNKSKHVVWNKNGHTEEWQDILEADVTLSDNEYNILTKTKDGKALLVDGRAANIKYAASGNSEITVQEAIDKALSSAKSSNASYNIIKENSDGVYAFVDMSYDATNNTLTFKHSEKGNDNIIKTDFKLNSLQFIDSIRYSSVTETMYIQYIDGNNKIQTLEIPIADIFNDFEVENDNNTVFLTYTRNTTGKDTLEANVKISNLSDNILINNSHSLYVKGTADNIKYENPTYLVSSFKNVKNALDILLGGEDVYGSIRYLIHDETTKALNAKDIIGTKQGTVLLTTDEDKKLVANLHIANNVPHNILETDTTSSTESNSVFVLGTSENIFLSTPLVDLEGNVICNNEDKEECISNVDEAIQYLTRTIKEVNSQIGEIQVTKFEFDATTKLLTLVYTDGNGVEQTRQADFSALKSNDKYLFEADEDHNVIFDVTDITEDVHVVMGDVVQIDCGSFNEVDEDGNWIDDDF